MKGTGSSPDRVVLDTSAYSWLRKGHAGVIDRLADARAVLVPTIVLGELEAAFLLGRRPAENREALRRFLERPETSIVPVSADIARRFGTVYAGLRRAGTPIGLNDIWIAATTIDGGAQLLTFDGDFQRVPGLDVALLSP